MITNEELEKEFLTFIERTKPHCGLSNICNIDCVNCHANRIIGMANRIGLMMNPLSGKTLSETERKLVFGEF